MNLFCGRLKKSYPLIRGTGPIPDWVKKKHVRDASKMSHISVISCTSRSEVCENSEDPKIRKDWQLRELRSSDTSQPTNRTRETGARFVWRISKPGSSWSSWTVTGNICCAGFAPTSGFPITKHVLRADACFSDIFLGIFLMWNKNTIS